MLIDSHCHLTEQKYKQHNVSVDTLINNASDAGVGKVITIGTSLNDNDNVLKIISQYPDVYSAIGVYPHEDLDQNIKDLESKLKEQIVLGKAAGKVVAIGECGIDLNALPEGQGRGLHHQIELFEMQINLALENDLPIVIHNRNGDTEILEILKHYKNKKLTGVVHCFVSSWEIAKKFLDLNFYISFTGIITYKSGNALYEAVSKVPYNKYLVETDSPYLSPEGHRKEINEPKYVKIVATKAAELRNEPFDIVAKNTYENTCRLFNIK